jgi:7-cyano-7-deazaguanine synthase in queuosine biosynthesis
MKVICAPMGWDFPATQNVDLQIVLFAHADEPDRGAAGASILRGIKNAKLRPEPRAWDLLSLALSVIAADTGVRRDGSPDGWTRQIDLRVAVSDPDFWSARSDLIERQLRFLTTDLWRLGFTDGGIQPTPPAKPIWPDEDAVSLLSGGLDSLVGAVDLVLRDGRRPYVVSQVSPGDKDKQVRFASAIGGGLRHLQLNHNANCPGDNEPSQRARSIIFLAYGVLLATALKRYHGGEEIPLFVCENGFIAINPPLTTGRLGSLSTRTAHPVFLTLFQQLLGSAGLNVSITNPYEFRTKGEMLSSCADQALLRKHASTTTSCGRYARTGFRHCGRCVPCLIRRAAFHAWAGKDATDYRYVDLSRDDDNHARFDDVRSAAMAVAEVRAEGLDPWLGASLTSTLIEDTAPYRAVAARGLEEISSFLDAAGVV